MDLKVSQRQAGHLGTAPVSPVGTSPHGEGLGLDGHRVVR